MILHHYTHIEEYDFVYAPSKEKGIILDRNEGPSVLINETGIQPWAKYRHARVTVDEKVFNSIFDRVHEGEKIPEDMIRKKLKI